MHWQDVVISICQLVGVVSLIPSITSNDKPALKTSIMNVALVSVIALTLLTLRLWFSAFTASLIAISWLILAIQKYKLPK